MVDLTRDSDGRLHARLLDVVPGRSGTAYTGWLTGQPAEFLAGIEHAALDPFRGYPNAVRDELPEAVAVLDAFHIVRLGAQVLDEVRRRCQQSTLGRRGHTDDPLYKIRGLLRHGRENLTDKQRARLNAGLGRRPGLRSHHRLVVLPAAARRLRRQEPRRGQEDRRAGDRLLPQLPDRRGRPPRPHPALMRQQVLAYFATSGVSNGGTEAVNLLIEKTRRLAHGFRNFGNYRLRILLAADGTRPYRRPTNHA